MNPKRKVKILMVTPELAERWLNANTHNRPLRNHLTDKYADSMKRGEWKLTAEPIAFCHPYTDSEGRAMKETLINGQHRLWAVVTSGMSVEMTVWWGCDPGEFDVIDQNAVRTFGDILATTRSDLADPTLVASVCSSTARYAFGFQTKNGGALRQSHIVAMLRHIEPEILAVVDYKKKLRKYASRPVVGALLLAQLVNPSMTEIIVKQLKDAVGFAERDPIRALHLYLSEQLSPTHRDSHDVQNYKTTHAICARLRGDHIRVLRITGEGLGWLRDAARQKIKPVIEQLYAGKGVPHNFYSPKLLMAETVAESTS